jgi:hypothetical protein
MKRAALLALALAAVPVHVGGDESARAGEFDALFQKHGRQQGVDWRLLRAIAEVESHLNPRAVNRRDPSIGLMGVLCRPRGETCGNRLDVAGWPPARREQLFDPDFNIAIGAQVLAWNVRTFGLERGIAVYNQWSARLAPKGKLFPNQFYVDQVLARYRARAGMPPAGGVANNTRSTGRMPQVIPPSGDRAGLPTIRAK